jgi:hypothetical protein
MSSTNDARSQADLFRIMNNPVINQQLHLAFTENLHVDKKMAVVDGFGRILMQETLRAGISEKQIDLTHMPSGVYMVWVSHGKYSQVQRFVLP